jgi:hypothetical protein
MARDQENEAEAETSVGQPNLGKTRADANYKVNMTSSLTSSLRSSPCPTRMPGSRLKQDPLDPLIFTSFPCHSCHHYSRLSLARLAIPIRSTCPTRRRTENAFCPSPTSTFRRPLRFIQNQQTLVTISSPCTVPYPTQRYQPMSLMSLRSFKPGWRNKRQRKRLIRFCRVW